MARPRVADLDTDFLEPGDRRVVRPQRLAVSRRGMAATAHYLATEAAADVLGRGGNAIDAAVTAAFALGVVEPAASGLGGQTMMLLYHAPSRSKMALDGSSRAPHRVVPGRLTQARCLRGHMAATVPSTPAVLAYALKRYGTIGLAEALEPAIRYAEEGYRITRLQHDLMLRERRKLRAGSAGRLFLRDGRRTYPAGAVFRQPVLAGTLGRLAREGVEDFYHGETALYIHDDMKSNGGLIREDDLAQIPWPIERKPLAVRFGDMRVLTLGPPGAGRTLVEVLNILGEVPERLWDIDTPKGAVLLAEIIRQANVDRGDRPFDRHLHPQESAERMLSREYARKAARRLRRRLSGRGETTHLSVMDAGGSVVALTQSIERVYGSFECSPHLGFLYNNYMSAFEYEDIRHPYYLRPGAVPWASVAPTMVFHGRYPWLAIGSPGSERIVSAIVQVLLRLRAETPYEAVNAPRLHCSIGGRVSLEASRMRDDIPVALRAHGLEVDERDPYSFYLGCVQLVLRSARGEFTGVADPRRDGSAGGPR